MVAGSDWFGARFVPAADGRPRSCPSCLAVVRAGEPSCPSCGSALRGRFGPISGPRSPSTIAAIALAVVAAVAGGAYAVLAPGPGAAPNTASASRPVPTTPAPAAGPRGTTGVTGASGTTGTTGVTGTAGVTATSGVTGVSANRMPPKIPAVTPSPKPAVAKSTPATTKPATTTPAGATTKPATGTTSPAASAPATTTSSPATISLGASDASTYNPYGLPSTSFGAPAKALAGNPLSSWTYRLDPSTQGATHAGLVVRLKPAQQVGSITLTSGSPGMKVEFYGASGALPTLITDPGWVHLASRTSIDAESTVGLGTRSEKLDYLLVWITHAPPGVNAGALTISALSLKG